MILAMALADVVKMDLAVNAIGYFIGIGFIGFLIYMIVSGVVRDRRYERETEAINELYQKSMNEPNKTDHGLH